MSDSAKNFKISEAITFGFEGAIANFIPLFLAIVITVASIGTLTLLLGAMFGYSEVGLAHLIGVVGHVVISVYAAIGAVIMSLKIVDGQKVHIRDFFHDFRFGLAFIGSSIIYFFAVAAGCLALVIPGIIIAIAFCFFRFLIVDKGLAAIESLSESAKITQGVRLNLFLLSCVLVLINLLGALCFVVGLLLTIPLTFIAHAWVYRRLCPASPRVEN